MPKFNLGAMLKPLQEAKPEVVAAAEDMPVVGWEGALTQADVLAWNGARGNMTQLAEQKIEIGGFLRDTAILLENLAPMELGQKIHVASNSTAVAGTAAGLVGAPGTMAVVTAAEILSGRKSQQEIPTKTLAMMFDGRLYLSQSKVLTVKVGDVLERLRRPRQIPGLCMCVWVIQRKSQNARTYLDFEVREL